MRKAGLSEDAFYIKCIASVVSHINDNKISKSAD